LGLALSYWFILGQLSIRNPVGDTYPIEGLSMIQVPFKEGVAVDSNKCPRFQKNKCSTRDCSSQTSTWSLSHGLTGAGGMGWLTNKRRHLQTPYLNTLVMCELGVLVFSKAFNRRCYRLFVST
jgi:hypothetical protein